MCVCVWVWAHHSFEFTKLTIIHSINQVTCVYLVKSKNLDLCAMSYTRNESKTFQFNWKCFCMCWPVDSVCDDVYMQFWKTVYAMNSLICTSTSLTRVWHIFLLPLSFWFVLTLAIAFLSASRNLMKMAMNFPTRWSIILTSTIQRNFRCLSESLHFRSLSLSPSFGRWFIFPFQLNSIPRQW